jgi:AraC family transcriptional regulator
MSHSLVQRHRVLLASFVRWAHDSAREGGIMPKQVFSISEDIAPLQVTTKFEDHVLGLHVSGKHFSRQEVDGRAAGGPSAPGAINLIPARLRAAFEADAPARVLMLFVPDAFLSRVLAEHWAADPQNVEIRWQCLVRDRVIEGVMTRLALEAQSGSPRGRLYAESACEFLAHHVIHAYSSLSTPPPLATGGLPRRRLNVVLEYIEGNLAQPIALRHLAGLAGVSARHFARAFRQAVGVPPYEYVLQRRIDVAQGLLLGQPKLTVGQVASRVGFSSSNHLASAFRRKTGYSPGAFRRHNAR